MMACCQRSCGLLTLNNNFCVCVYSLGLGQFESLAALPWCATLSLPSGIRRSSPIAY